jgi:predicted transposase YbfD/YdcC
MALIAVTAGAEHWNEIALYCKSKEEMLKTEFDLELENGTPTDDTFQRIFAIIKPKEFEKCFVNWVKSIIKVPDKEIVSLDGKTLRGSQDKEDNLDVIHMVSAWANSAGVVLGQVRVNEKSNEIPAVPELLDCIDVKNCVITSDAMSCQKKTVQKITEHECDYVICLKGNQETLHEDVKLYFETAEKEPNFYPLSKLKTSGKDHGRIEKREYFLTDDIDWLSDKQEWCNLNAIGMVRSTRIIKGVETVDVRYFISSVTDIKLFAKAVRQHWGIENSLHWCLDMCFDEDHCRMRVDNSAENFAVLRHIATNLYKSFTSVKLSLKAKRFRCSFDDRFLADVIFNKFS